jgi:predicted Zn-dependent protease
MNRLSRRVTRIAGVAAALGLALGAASPASAQSAIRDTEIEGIIHEWADPVFTAMGLEPSEVEVLLINDNDLNAFAVPGRVLGVNTGLILKTRNPNQLLGVVAHEAGHIKNRHVLREGAQSAAMQPMLMTMALGALAIAAGAPDAGAVLLGNSQYFGTLSAIRYISYQEGEADNTAARALERAGESGKGLVDFFENFRSQEVFSDARRYPYFRTHPLSSDRIENLRRLVAEQPHYGHRDSPERMAEHALVLAKIHAFMDAPNATLRAYPETDTSLPARYARAIAWYRDGQTEKALAAVDVLLEEDPENPYYWELKGQILFEEGHAAEAVGAHQRSVDLKPDAPLLRINLGHALLESNDPAKLDQAVDELKRATALEQDNTQAWR